MTINHSMSPTTSTVSDFLLVFHSNCTRLLVYFEMCQCFSALCRYEIVNYLEKYNESINH